MNSQTVDFLAAKDGYKVTLVELSYEISLYVGFQSGGSYVPKNFMATQLLYRIKNPTTLQRGEAYRLYALLEAFCNYFNAGGSWGELELFDGLKNILAKTVSFSGYEYCGAQKQDQDIVHFWQNSQGDQIQRKVPAETYLCVKKRLLGISNG